ncbi:MAG: ECF-type sigma factor [Holophagales bacterium]|nr:ECF-type sigma factor [Holophagales bacterium]
MSQVQIEQARQSRSIEQLLGGWSRGDLGPLSGLVSRLYGQLYRLAEGLLARQWSDGRWQPGALVHELYLTLTAKRGIEWRSVEHFLAIAHTEMRRYLIADSRRKRTFERGFGKLHVELLRKRADGLDGASKPGRIARDSVGLARGIRSQ